MDKLSNEEIALELVKATGVLEKFYSRTSPQTTLKDTDKTAEDITALYKAVLKKLEE